jgi:hypothetical protein
MSKSHNNGLILSNTETYFYIRKHKSANRHQGIKLVYTLSKLTEFSNKIYIKNLTLLVTNADNQKFIQILQIFGTV